MYPTGATACLRSPLRLALIFIALVWTGIARADCPEQIFGAWDIENTRGVPEGNVLYVGPDSGKVVGIYNGSVVRWRLEGDYANGMWTGTFHAEVVGSSSTLNGTFQYAYHPGGLPGRDQLDGSWLDRGSTTNQYLGRPHVDPVCPSPTTTLPSCTASQGSSVPQCHGNLPQVTELFVPAVIQENKIAPVTVSFVDPGGAVNSIQIEAQSFGMFVASGGAQFAPVRDGGAESVSLTCSGTGGLRPPGVNATFTIRATVGDVEGQTSAPSSTKSYTCVAKGLALKLVAGAAESLASAAFVAAAVAYATDTNPLRDPTKAPAKIAALVLAFKLYKAAIEIYNSDPPDPAFTAIAAPVPPSLPTIQADEGTPQELADALNALLGNYADAVGLVEALRVAYERAQGAGEGKSVEWYSMQMEAARGYASRWASALREHVPRAAALQAAWAAAGFPETAVLAEDVRTLQDEVRASGVPAPLRDLLVQAGAGDLAPLADVMLNANPDTVAAGSFPAILTSPALTAGVDEAVGALDRFVAAFADAACGGPCDDRDACTQDMCTGTQCQHGTLRGADGICSSCQGGLQSRACAGQSVPAAVGKRLAQACSLHAQVAGSKTKVGKRLARQAARSVRAARALIKKAAKKHKQPVSRECATLMADVLRGAL